jgi:Tfp pilus assembly protein PilN
MSDPGTAPTPEAPPAPSRRRARKQAKKSLWQMDLSSIGKKDADADLQDRIERPPFQPTLPQVNLLPQKIVDATAVRRIRRWAIAAVALLVLAVGGIWWLQGSTITRAEADLAAATAENTRLRAELESLTPVKQMYEQITRLQGVVTTTLASQPEAAVVLARLGDAAQAAGGPDIVLSNAEVNYSGIPEAGGLLNPCPNPDPFGTDITVGCLSFTATAGSRQQVSALLREMAADPLFVGPYVTSSSVTALEGGQDSVAFSGSAGVSLEALRTQLTPEQVEALLAPPPPPAPASPAAEEAQ